jgi:hypothetical protein
LTEADFAFGSDSSDSGKFIAVVMGDNPDVAKLHKEVCRRHNLKRIHMRRIREKAEVARTLGSLKTPYVQMFCFYVDRSQHSKTLDTSPKTRYLSRVQKNQRIDYCTMAEIIRSISSSLRNFRQSWGNISVQADSDTKKMFRASGRTIIPPGCAYELADAVAWSNYAKKTPSHVKEIDLRENIDNELHRQLKF